MSKPKPGRFDMSVTEEMIMNQDYEGYSAGRIEVYDKKVGGPYHHYEGRFWVPSVLMTKFRALFDGQHDLPIMIHMPMKVIKTKDLNKTEEVWEKRT